MRQGNESGKTGENIARQYLVDQGYEILETNWHVGHWEADIIAYKDQRIVFVEVKTRKSAEYGNPEEFVDRKKQQNYIKLANAYMLQKDRYEEVRFDIIALLYNGGKYELTHIQEAFTTIG